jgi:hypothetical protein
MRVLLVGAVLISLLSMSASAQRKQTPLGTTQGPYFIVRIPPTGQYLDNCILVRPRQAGDTSPGELIPLRGLEKNVFPQQLQ